MQKNLVNQLAEGRIAEPHRGASDQSQLRLLEAHSRQSYEEIDPPPRCRSGASSAAGMSPLTRAAGTSIAKGTLEGVTAGPERRT